MTAFKTPADLAEMLVTSEANILRWRIEQDWPSLKVGRSIRFTPDHVDQILTKLEVKPKPEPVTAVAEVVVSGQTARSARSRRSA